VKGVESGIDGKADLLFFYSRRGLYAHQVKLVPDVTPDAHEDTTAPAHYLEGRPAQYEPRYVIAAWDLTYNLGSAVKYLARAGRKGGPADHIRDLEKARDFLKFEIDRLQGAGFYKAHDLKFEIERLQGADFYKEEK
jgi:hypothetical protein